jgi:large conductance mechanosensitive channel
MADDSTGRKEHLHSLREELFNSGEITKAKRMLKEFKEFAIKGNAVDLAVGIVVGAAFTGIVSSLVKDIIMPPIGVVTGGVDFSNMFFLLKSGKDGADHYASLKLAQDAGAVTLNFGLFINALINFLIVAFAVFLLIRALQKMKRPQPSAPPVAKDCPSCAMTIPLKAKRCPHCTTELSAPTAPAVSSRA